MSIKKRGSIYFKSQQGIILIVVLIMLLVMTSVGVTLMSGATLQESMSSSSRQFSLAQANAEAALRRAEQEITTDIVMAPTPTIQDAIANFFNNDTTGSRYVDSDVAITVLDVDINANKLNNDLSYASGWTTSNSVAAAVTSTSTTLPRYVIEYIGQTNFGEIDSSVDVSIEKKLKLGAFPHFFRITAIGYGADDDIVSVLQSVFSTGSN